MAQSTTSTDIAARLRLRRAELGWSQQELATKIGTAQSSISEMETEQAAPTLPTLIRWCAALGFIVTLDDTLRPAIVDAGWTVPAAPPRVWQLPPEPGPEVTAVRDSDGDLWTRVADGWLYRANDAAYNSRPWSEIMAYGPLTDASDEVTP